VGNPLDGSGETVESDACVSSDRAARYFRSDAISDSHWAIRFKTSRAVGGESRFQRPMRELSVAERRMSSQSAAASRRQRRLVAWRRLFASLPLARGTALSSGRVRIAIAWGCVLRRLDQSIEFRLWNCDHLAHYVLEVVKLRRRIEGNWIVHGFILLLLCRYGLGFSFSSPLPSYCKGSVCGWMLASLPVS